MAMNKKWAKTSATQHQAFLDCERYWYYGWVMRLPRGTSEALMRGIGIHNESERFLKTGEIREHNYALYVKALQEHFPPPRHPDLLVEHSFSIPCGKGLPNWIGKIDIGFSGNEVLQLHDIKTTSDFRWAKTRAELLDNIQMISYARAAYETFGYSGDIELGHLYVKTTKAKKPRKMPQTKLVSVVTDQSHVNVVWEREMETVRRMTVVRDHDNVLDVSPTGVETGYCEKYEGCPFAERCPRPKRTVKSLFSKTNTQTPEGPSEMNSLMNKLKNKSKAPETEEKEEAKKPEKAESPLQKRLREAKQKGEVEDTAEEDVQISPPDAAPRTTAVLTAEEKAELEKAKAKPKTKKKTKAKKSSDDGFCLYINCFPVKTDCDEPTMFEDWFGSILFDLNEKVKEEHGVSDYRLLEYGAPNIALTAAVSAKLGSLPPSMVVANVTSEAEKVLAIIQPKATQVIRSVR